MKWVEYHSEEGEIWEILKEESDFEKIESEEISRNGNCAVYRKEMATTDSIQVCLIPAARVIDDVSGKIGREKEFYIKLALLNDDWFSISNRAFKKEEAIQLVGYFAGVNKRQAERIWKAKKLGVSNTYRLER
jgi:hypothetical protein